MDVVVTVNGVDEDKSSMDDIGLKNHWNVSSLVHIKIKGTETIVNGYMLIKAIERCMNTRSY